MEACEAREHGSDSRKNHQVEGSIIQAQEWTRAFGRCNLVEHAVTKQHSKHECTGRNPSQEEATRPVGPGWLASPLFKASGARLPHVSH
jgi:hypothetical protein